MNDFFSHFMPKTDLASEIHEYLSQKSDTPFDGITSECFEIDGLAVSEITVLNEQGAKTVGKPIGKYSTISIGSLSLDSHDRFKEKCIAVSKKLKEFIPCDGACLFAGLGNRRITADASGPEVADSFLVTRHIKGTDNALFNAMQLRETMCVSTDVLGNTGIEASELLRGVVNHTKPDFMVVADSLATSRMSRLATTVQICNTGISPGSGVNNKRSSIDDRAMGIPVIAIGIPTVADIYAVIAEMLSGIDSSSIDPILRHAFDSNGRNRFVTPKDADSIIRNTSRLIAYSLNLALHQSLGYEDMCELVRK